MQKKFCFSRKVIFPLEYLDMSRRKKDIFGREMVYANGFAETSSIW